MAVGVEQKLVFEVVCEASNWRLEGQLEWDVLAVSVLQALCYCYCTTQD